MTDPTGGGLLLPRGDFNPGAPSEPFIPHPEQPGELLFPFGWQTTSAANGNLTQSGFCEYLPMDCPATITFSKALVNVTTPGSMTGGTSPTMMAYLDVFNDDGTNSRPVANTPPFLALGGVDVTVGGERDWLGPFTLNKGRYWFRPTLIITGNPSPFTPAQYTIFSTTGIFVPSWNAWPNPSHKWAASGITPGVSPAVTGPGMDATGASIFIWCKI